MCGVLSWIWDLLWVLSWLSVTSSCRWDPLVLPRARWDLLSLQWERLGHFDASSFTLCLCNGGVWQEVELGLVPLTDCRVWDVRSNVDPCRLLALL